LLQSLKVHVLRELSADSRSSNFWGTVITAEDVVCRLCVVPSLAPKFSVGDFKALVNGRSVVSSSGTQQGHNRDTIFVNEDTKVMFAFSAILLNFVAFP
jgi:hypothetical protein